MRSSSCVKGEISKLRSRSVTESPRSRDAQPSTSSSWPLLRIVKRSTAIRAVSMRMLRAKMRHTVLSRRRCEGRMRTPSTGPSGPGSDSSWARSAKRPDMRRSVSSKPAESCTRPSRAPPVSERSRRWSMPA